MKRVNSETQENLLIFKCLIRVNMLKRLLLFTEIRVILSKKVTFLPHPKKFQQNLFILQKSLLEQYSGKKSVFVVFLSNF